MTSTTSGGPSSRPGPCFARSTRMLDGAGEPLRTTVRRTDHTRTTDVVGDQEDVMNKLGTRSVKLLAIVATAAGAVVCGVGHTSATSQPVWIPQSNGCFVLSYDGGVSGAEMQCSAGNGNIDVYVPATSGQWAYSQT